MLIDAMTRLMRGSRRHWWRAGGGMLKPIKPCQQFGDCNVEFLRDIGIQIDLHQQRDQLRRFVDINTGLARSRDDGFRQQSAALGDNPGGVVLIVIGESDCGPVVFKLFHGRLSRY